MSPSREQIEAQLGSLRDWLSSSNIVGLHVAPASTPGSEDFAIVFQVKELPMGQGDRPIPPCIEMTLYDEGHPFKAWIPTQVIEVGANRLDLYTGEALSPGSTTRERPCPGGFMIHGSEVPGGGTLGVNIELPWADDQYSLLSCNHVLSWNGRSKIVYQPYQNTSRDKNFITMVKEFTEVVTYPTQFEKHPTLNRYDLAWCPIDTASGSPNVNLVKGAPKGFRAAALGDKVVLVGYRTATPRHARVVSTAAVMKTEWLGAWAWFERVILLDKVVTAPGDSGAAYLAGPESDRRVVGVHVGANKDHSWGCALPSPRDGLTPPT